MRRRTRRTIREQIDAIYRADSRRVLATLIRLLGDFDLAEEALHDAFATAVERWPADGMPAQSARVARVDRTLQVDRPTATSREIRREPRRGRRAPRRARGRPRLTWTTSMCDDDRLRLIFTCCHPALAPTRRSRSRCVKCAA